MPAQAEQSKTRAEDDESEGCCPETMWFRCKADEVPATRFAIDALN
jgi:hypothetical protein